MRLLKKLYSINSPSYSEFRLRNFILRWLKRNVPDHKVEVDAYGNVLITNGESETYPCVVAHMDEVQDIRPRDFRVMSAKDVLFGFCPSVMEQMGLGADDKNGIWIALKLLKRLPALKVAFFVEEEVGCNGSYNVDLRFFSDCRFIIQCDRRNGGDFITTASGVKLCDQAFVTDMQPAKYGYKATNGLMTDVMILRERGLLLSTCNLSCGYYFPHTPQEVTVIGELLNCLSFVENACKRLTKVYPAPVVTRHTVGYSVNQGWRNRYMDYYAYTDDDPTNPVPVDAEEVEDDDFGIPEIGL